MFVHVIDLAVGQGDADTLLNRIQSDLIPIYQVAQGFVAYYAVKQTDNSVTTIRVFEDLPSIEAAAQAAHTATEQIVSDLQLEPTEHIRGEAAIHVP
jgi:hypothetical protein